MLLVYLEGMHVRESLGPHTLQQCGGEYCYDLMWNDKEIFDENTTEKL
jgi:hypothetical protein